MTTSDAFSEAMREEMADRERYRLAHVSRCQACGRSATGAEWDLLRHASAMNFALGHVRYLADAASYGVVPVGALLRAVSEPYRFPLPAPVTITRDQLAAALTRLEVRIPATGPSAGKIDAESMADAIIEALEGLDSPRSQV